MLVSRRGRAALAGMACAGFALPCAAAEKDPKVPPGNDPGGFAVAVLSAGVDYTDPAVARRLARDGEGELIGYDVVGNDARPFAPPATGAAPSLAKRLAALPGVRLIAVRVAPDDPASIARGSAFAGQTPARVVIMPPAAAAEWELVRQAAARASKMLFLVMPPVDGSSPAAPDPDQANVLELSVLADRARDEQGAIEAVAVVIDRLLGCSGREPEARDGAAMRSALYDALAPSGPGAPLVLNPCPGR